MRTSNNAGETRKPPPVVTSADRRKSYGGRSLSSRRRRSPSEDKAGGGRTRQTKERHYTPLRFLKLEKSRMVLFFPLPSDQASLETDIEKTTRDMAIDLGQSPPVGFHYKEICIETWNTVASIVKSKTMPSFQDIFEAAPQLPRTMKFCVTVFSSVDAAVTFVSNRSGSLTIKSDSGGAITQLRVHAVEAAPVDLFPLSRVTSHPAFLDIRFDPSPLENLYYRKCTEPPERCVRGPTIWGLPLPSAFFIHQRRGPDRRSRPLFTTPLGWQCLGCETQNVCADTCRYCMNCGSARTVLSPLRINAADPPPEIAHLMRRPCPTLREFSLRQNACGLHYNADEDVFMVPDEAPDRESYTFFTRDGLFYTLDIPTGDLIFTHAISVESAPAMDECLLMPVKEIPRQMASAPQSTAGDEQRLANASLVASVLAQAQRAAAQLSKSSSAVAAPTVKPPPAGPADLKTSFGIQTSGPVKLSIPNKPAAPQIAATTESRIEWQALNVETPKEINTGTNIVIVDPARKPSVRELRMHQTSALEEEQCGDTSAEKRGLEQGGGGVLQNDIDKEEEDLICFICLRQFCSASELAQHELHSITHKINLRESLIVDSSSYVRSV